MYAKKKYQSKYSFEKKKEILNLKKNCKHSVFKWGYKMG